MDQRVPPLRNHEPSPERNDPLNVAGCRQSRRHWVRLAVRGIAASAGLSQLVAARAMAVAQAGNELIVRTLRPLNLESPSHAFDSWVTPSDLFFVRSHFGAPRVEVSSWTLEITGLVDRPLTLGLDELRDLRHVSIPAVLQCAGNGRALYRPRMPGIGWERGAVGNAEWSGIRLADLLERASIKPGAAHLHLIGGDTPPSPKTPAFIRSIPLDRGLLDDTILALGMNGQPLHVLHGGPLRVIVPGWAGNNWIKWLRRIVVAADEAPGFYMQTGYRMPTTPFPAGVAPKPADLKPVTWMNVKSLITAPSSGQIHPAKELEIRGVAWTGQGHVTGVEFTTDHDPRWRPATLIDDARPGTWRRFRATWVPPGPGKYLLRVRATDSMGQVQPEVPAWNRSGYLWNGIDPASFTIG